MPRFSLLLPGLLALWLAAAPAAAQLGGSKTGGLGFGKGSGGPMTVSAQFTAPKEGQPATLFVKAQLKPGWHIYSLTQAAGGPLKSEIKVLPTNGVTRVGAFRASPPPETTVDEAFEGIPIEIHEGTVVWRAPIDLAPGADLQGLKIEGKLSVQLCDAGSCQQADFPFTAALGPGIAEPQAAATGATVFSKEELAKNLAKQEQGGSLWLQLAAGFLGGVLLNLMPCVLPVIGLKILSFVEQSGHDRKTALVLNVWYSLGLVAVFWALAGLAIGLNLGWGGLFQDPAFNIFMAALVFAMALAFLGVWEFPVPGFVGRGAAVELAEREGVAGAFLKGVITTLLATPCTGPFMGAALGWAVKQPPPTVFAVFTSVGLGMASPYLLIGAFPKLIRFLPKPGAWMDTFKQIMGFVLLGTVVFILSFLKTAHVVPTVGLLFALWLACWWLARTPPTAELGAKLRAWLEAAAIVGAAWFLLFFLKFSNPLPWQPFTSRAAFERLVNSGNTVLVDFTADWCSTCKTLEFLYLNTRQVRELVEKNRVVTLKADWTHKDPEVAAMLEMLGSSGVPVVAVFPAGRPNEPISFIGGYTQGKVLEALEKAGPSKAASPGRGPSQQPGAPPGP